MPEIFVSYCREDQAIARQYAEGLQQAGFGVWWDQALNAGESFDQVTERALKEARAVVVLWSRRSVQSRWVRSEATLADRYGTMVPVMIEPCERPIMFELTHTADLSGWKGDAGDARWKSLVAGLRRQTGAASPASISDAAAVAGSSGWLRKPLVLGGGVAAVIIAAWGAWMLAARVSNPDPGGLSIAVPAPGSAQAGAIAAPAVSGLQELAGKSSPQVEVYPVTDFDGMKGQAAISADGTLVAFLANRDGPYDVWVTRVGSNEFRNLTQGRKELESSATTRMLEFSADGSQLLVSGRSGSNPNDTVPNTWSVSVLGGALRPFIDGAAEIARSPDGGSYVYRTSVAGDPVFVRPVGQGPARQVFAGIAGDHNHFPIWSRDGQSIYMMHGVEMVDGMDIWRIPAAGGSPERMTFHNTKLGFPVFLDERTLAYLAEEKKGNGQTLHLLDVVTRVTRAVRSGLDRYTTLAASADGRKLVATVATRRATLWRVPVGDRAAAPSAASRVRVSTRGGSWPRADRADLLYVSSGVEGNGLWRMSGETATEIWNATRGEVMGAPTLEPGIGRIAFPVRSGGATRLYVGNADGTGLRQLAPGLDLRGSPAWSPDGRWIAAAADTAGGPRLYKIPVNGGSPVELTRHYGIDPTWSPDGAFLVYAAEQVGPSFKLAAVQADGQPRSIPAIELPYGATRTAFLPGAKGSQTLIVRKGDLQHTEFWLVDLAGGSQRPLTAFGPDYQLGDFDVSPDGREIIFDRVREESNVVLMDLGPRI